jgi:hypothetical protein
LNCVLIEQQFFIVFSTDDDRAVLSALNTLLALGLSEDQILEGIKAGQRFLIEEAKAKHRLKNILRNQ